MKNNLQEKPQRVGVRPHLSKSPSKLIVGISALISMLAIAAYKEEGNPSAKQAIGNKPTLSESKTKNEAKAEADLSFDTATKLQPLIKLILNNPWVLIKIKQGANFQVALNSKYNVAIDTEQPDDLINDGYSIYLTILNKKGDPVLSCIVDHESDHTEVSITDWTITTFAHKDGHFIEDGPFTASFTTADKKNNTKLPQEVVQILELI